MNQAFSNVRNIARSREWSERKMAPIWMSVNGNKRSLTLDLQKPEAVAVIHRPLPTHPHQPRPVRRHRHA